MNSIKQIFFRYLASLPRACELSGWKLYDAMYARTGVKTTPATLLKYAREYSALYGARFTCISNKDSKYAFIQGPEKNIRYVRA